MKTHGKDCHSAPERVPPGIAPGCGVQKNNEGEAEQDNYNIERRE